MLSVSLNKTFPSFLPPSHMGLSWWCLVPDRCLGSPVVWAATCCEVNLTAPVSGRKEGRKEMFYLTMHSTHFILRLYGIRHMVKDDSDSERGNPLLPHGLLLRLTARVLLYAPSHREDDTYHGLCYTSRGFRLMVFGSRSVPL